ncbi:MAG: D-amino acid dehydrogenase [Proteobacteria bacterium]|nr:D-amino acid dehydrogenase [Pseudomonadota bacterium]
MRVLVLGAGVIGVTSAWYLTRAGHEVTLVDRQPDPGLETSRANGGQISAGHAEPWASPDVIPKVLRWLGREDAPLLFRPRADWAQWEWGLRFLRECLPGRFERNTRNLAGLALHSRDCLKALRAETGIEYDQVTRGILQFCVDEAEFEAVSRHAQAMNRYGIRREVKSAPECLAIEPALGRAATPVVGGVFTPEDESGDAHKFTQRLARLAVERGAVFLGGASVEAVESAGDRIVAARLSGAKAQRVEADAFVVALGSYSPQLLRPLGIRIPVYPLKGYSITIPLSARAAEIAPTISLSDEAGKVVISRLGDRLRAAGTAELNGYDLQVNAVRCASILERVKGLFPGIADEAQVEPWAGLRPATPTNAPAVGRTRYSNLFLNTGHGTLGWTLACGSGRAIAEIVSGRPPGVDFAFT